MGAAKTTPKRLPQVLRATQYTSRSEATTTTRSWRCPTMRDARDTKSWWSGAVDAAQAP